MELLRALPKVRQISMYATARDILNKTDEELLGLKAGLDMVYVGLESGSDEI